METAQGEEKALENDVKEGRGKRATRVFVTLFQSLGDEGREE